MSDPIKDIFDTPDNSNMYDTQDVNDNKVFAVLAYFGILFWLPLVVNSRSRFGKFHANQAFILFLTSIILEVASNIVCAIIRIIPFIGGTISGIISLIVSALLLVYMILGMYNAGTGRAKELPLICGLIHVFDK